MKWYATMFLCKGFTFLSMCSDTVTSFIFPMSVEISEYFPVNFKISGVTLVTVCFSFLPSNLKTSGVSLSKIVSTGASIFKNTN